MGDNTFIVRTKQLTDDQKSQIINTVQERLSPGGVDLLAFDLVSAVVAAKTVVNSFYAVLAAAVGIFLYLWWAFRNVPSPFRYGAAAIIALVHDSLVVIGIFAILGGLLDIEVNTMFLVAILTVIGYSVNDTIVVFDRLRENIIGYPNRSLAKNANISIIESLGRSLNTSLTLIFTIIALIVVGGETIRIFLYVLLIGVIAGTYSSIGIATQFLVMWEQGVFKRLFRRSRSSETSTDAANA